jgi:hypothetical protein
LGFHLLPQNIVLTSLKYTSSSLFWPIFMNKLGYQPLPVLLRAEPSDARSTPNSARFLRVIATLGTLFALCGVIAIFLIGFRAFPPKTLGSKKSVEVPVLPATTLSAAVAPSLDQSVGGRLPDTNQVSRETIAEDHSIIDQPPVAPAGTPTSTAAQISQPQASVSDGDSLKRERPEDAQSNPDRYLPEGVRKKLERHRQEAERKRSRLEEMYGKHAISRDAYKKGEQKYKTEIERYRTKMSVRTGPNNQESQGQN